VNCKGFMNVDATPESIKEWAVKQNTSPRMTCAFTDGTKMNIEQNVVCNATGLLPAKRGYYAFEGSLTTPPCSEEVRWLVLKTPVKIGTEQVAAFVGRLRTAPFASAFQRAPGIAESVEWAKALIALDTVELDPEVVADTAGILFKQRDDVAALTRELASDLLKPEEEAAP